MAEPWHCVLQDKSSPGNAVCFHPNGRHVLGVNSAIGAWDFRAGVRVVETPLPGEESSEAAIPSLALSPDGTLVAAGKLSVSLWRFTDHGDQDVAMYYDKKLSTPDHLEFDDESADAALHSVAFSPNGGEVAAAFGGDSVWIWDVATGAVRIGFSLADSRLDSPRTFAREDFTAAAFAPDGECLLVAARGSEESKTCLALLDGITGEELDCHEFESLDRGGGPFAFSPDGSVIAAGNGASVVFWNVAAGTVEELRLPTRRSVSSLAFSSEGQQLLVAQGERLTIYRVLHWQEELLGRETLSLAASHHIQTTAFSGNERDFAYAAAEGVTVCSQAAEIAGEGCVSQPTVEASVRHSPFPHDYDELLQAVQAAATDAMTDEEKQQSVRRLIRAVQDPAPRPRQAALEGFRRTQTVSAAVTLLEKQLNHPDLNARVRAAWALARLRTTSPRSLEVLADAFETASRPATLEEIAILAADLAKEVSLPRPFLDRLRRRADQPGLEF
ncbi:MAG: hypothetical protein N2C14_32485, partial [Planctomycetales bacterium]